VCRNDREKNRGFYIRFFGEGSGGAKKKERICESEKSNRSRNMSSGEKGEKRKVDEEKPVSLDRRSGEEIRRKSESAEKAEEEKGRRKKSLSRGSGKKKPNLLISDVIGGEGR